MIASAPSRTRIPRTPIYTRILHTHTALEPQLDRAIMRYHSPLFSGRDSVASDQSVATIVPSAPPTPAGPPKEEEEEEDSRWSEVVPPHSALTFGVEWDGGDAGMTISPVEMDEATFRRARGSARTAPSDIDGRSQVLTIGTSGSLFGLGRSGDAGEGRASEYTTTLQFLSENHGFKFADSAYFPGAPNAGRTSSTLDGLDVYLRGSMMGRAHNGNRYASCFEELDGTFTFDPRTSFARDWLHDEKRDNVSDEGFSEGGLYEGDDSHLPSRFSTTTTSTSNYVNVDFPADMMNDASSASWSKLDAPNTPGYQRTSSDRSVCLIHSNAAAEMFPRQPTASSSDRSANTAPSRNRLHKHRATAPAAGPAPPVDVLSRSGYNHDVPSPTPLALPLPPPVPCRSHSSPGPARARSPTATASPIVAVSPRARNLSMKTLPAKLRSIGSSHKGKSKPEPAGWVWVDVREDRLPPVPTLDRLLMPAYEM
ncbi:unnamed protein product [Mycena citricolor]|uniref:Uncharacterized protein n=1 Tax=Mycena citricolor TaxID=2018698 RepID=A0AAD2H8T7_9AGAR|nr:unnamed protein product [Mycena citricolor]